jgi:hypothetical protein
VWYNLSALIAKHGKNMAGKTLTAIIENHEIIKRICLLPRSVDDFLSNFSTWRFLKEVRTPILIFFLTRIFLVLAVYYGIVLFGGMGAALQPGAFPDNLFLSPWARWDAGHYARIVENGYKEFGSAAFFPFFPFLAKCFNLLLHDSLLSEIIVANLSFLIALIFLYRLVSLKFKDQSLAERVVLYLAIFPTSFFFTCALSESTFLLMSILTFYFAEKEKWWLAGMFGVLASMTRSVGFLITIPIILIYLFKKKLDLRQVRLDLLPILAIPLGVLLFMGILLLYGRHPLDFIAANRQAWPRIIAFPWWDLSRSIEMITSYDLSAFFAGNFPVRLLAGVVLVSLFLILSIIVLFKVDFSYGIYSLLSMLFFLSNPAKEWQLYSNLRFIVVIFPVFILLAQYGKNKWINYLVITFSLLFLAIFATYNGMGGWIS